MDDLHVSILLTLLSAIAFAITAPGRYKPWVYWVQAGVFLLFVSLIGKLLGIAPD